MNTAEKFISLFKSSLNNEEFISWSNDESVGFSIFKKYPENGLFIPAKKKNGDQDSVALVNIGYRKNEIRNKKVLIIVRISKTSRYLLNNHWNYDFDDENSPTKESLEVSNSSKQPVTLEDSARYEFDLDKYQLYDFKIKKNTEPTKIVEDIFKLHLKTLKNIPFRTKMWLQRYVIDKIEPLNNLIKWINFHLFGRSIRPSKEYSIGTFKPYPYKDLIALKTEKTNILGWDFFTTNQTNVTFIIFLLLIFLPNYYFHNDLFGLVSLTKESAKNPLFIFSLTSGFLFFFDRGIPYLLLSLINGLIKLKLLLLTWKIKIQ